MQLIQPIVSGNNLNSNGFNDLIDGIDRTIANLATIQFKNDIFGFNDYINMDIYFRLCTYREILIDKLMGCGCLDTEYTIYITSNIQKLIC